MKTLKLLCVSLVTMSLVLVGPSTAKIDFENCVGLWLFDEGGGGEAEDSSGKDNHATIEGGENGWMASLVRL